MKKSFIILSISAIAVAFASCGGSSNHSEGDTTAATNQTAVAHNSDAVQETTATNNGAEKTGASEVKASDAKGAQLISKNDCLTCHKEHDKLIGPAYADVAKKYTDKDVDMLADKVIKGGAGNWGQIAMTPHPNLSQEDAKEMVKYILSIK
ncbi:c-type cytochrome [Mucilaginibacter sp. RS28]|uniref:C-type cytochrome n=1 Tax=Mucilaginibacter straminoryzae TaxID=2932774 RepID=A0A9X1XA33_9SPHI|nr:c-type cytochrome [Mucilaginibacter straminoryzae]MCJ8210949.1 c-type cytochrome [Mucilaginibacter straminoryzae]